MKCGYCNGTGEHVNDANRMTTCEFCGGTGVIKPLTNKEWLNSLSINERADEIIGYIANTIGLARYYNDNDVAEFVEWLKEIHHD